MTDTTTQKPLRVSNEGTAGPYIMLPYSQLNDLQQLLDRHGVRYWVRENIISIDRGPAIVTVDLGRGSDLHAVQAILDSVN